jgi:caprin-1
MLEKKVRNLEKRKAKLDGYRADSQRGKELNADQKLAISKYEEVLQTLEFARELSGQFKTLIQEEDKNRKKLQKKEQLEKAKSEAQKLAQVLEIQDMLFQLSKSRVRNDFSNGNHNAVKLTKEQLGLIDDFSKTVTGRKLNDPEYEKNATASSEQLLNLLEGKATKKTGKTNFKDLKDLFDSIKACGYFQMERPEDEEGKHGKGKKENSVTSSPSSANGEDRVKKDEVAAKAEPPKELEPVVQEVIAEPLPVAQPQQFEQPQQPQLQQPLQREAFNHHHEQPQQPQQHEQIHPPHQSQIDFFQDSQIDLNAPHMDPAVVVVHQHTPPQHMMMMQQPQQGASAIHTQTFTNQMYIPPTTLAAMQAQHHEQLMTFASQQQPMPPQQPQEHHQQQQHFEYQHEEDLAKRMGQVGIFPEADVNETGKDQGYDQRSPPQQPQDTMANIDEWENDQAGNATGNGEDFNRTGSWRGRGRGRGGPSGPRGERRGGYRGDRDGDRDGGYRGGRGGGGPRGERRGGYRGDRDGDREGGYRGDRGGPRGPRSGDRDRDYRGGPRGSGNSGPRGGTGRPYPRSNGFHENGNQ